MPLRVAAAQVSAVGVTYFPHNYRPSLLPSQGHSTLVLLRGMAVERRYIVLGRAREGWTDPRDPAVGASRCPHRWAEVGQCREHRTLHVTPMRLPSPADGKLLVTQEVIPANCVGPGNKPQVQRRVVRSPLVGQHDHQEETKRDRDGSHDDSRECDGITVPIEDKSRSDDHGAASREESGGQRPLERPSPKHAHAVSAQGFRPPSRGGMFARVAGGCSREQNAIHHTQVCVTSPLKVKPSPPGTPTPTP